MTDNDIPKIRENCKQCRGDACQGHNPGQEFAQRLCVDLDQAVVIQPPLGEDLTTWVQRHGVDSVRERLGT